MYLLLATMETALFTPVVRQQVHFVCNLLYSHNMLNNVATSFMPKPLAAQMYRLYLKIQSASEFEQACSITTFTLLLNPRK